ncbi:caspase, EACC1-associated type [Saccharopolyspora hattusasensis]|uniref:caspase, EACC1-associated type n=1 Tax=Saccharopolyspora hattusasensis TaxID=1128679 RepID=UPI003D956DAD
MTVLGKRALLIGTAQYSDNRFKPLACTRADTAQFRQVLEHPAIGAFDSVDVLDSPSAHEMRVAIGDFLEKLGSGDLALLYISGHGIRLARTTGEFFFIASDTDGDAIEHTGVSATFVNEQLELCLSPQKVAIFDCCYSGGFSLGFRTHDAKSMSNSSALLSSRGVFVMSSSGADEKSWGDGDAHPDPRPSAFTSELVEALRTGRGDTGNDGLVSAEELFHYVNERVRRLELDEPQIPAYSADKVNGQIHLARSYAGPPLTPPMVRRAPEPAGPRTTKSDADGSPVSWQLLLDYYRECVTASASDMSLMNVDEADETYVCLPGTERLLSGDLDETGSIPLPDDATKLAEQADREEAALWYGYPAVLLRKAPNGETYRRPRFAPLLIRPVEITTGDDGPRIRPYGTPIPHPALAEHVLGAEQAAVLRDTFMPQWHAGMHSQMVQQIRHDLREDFKLIDAQPLQPGDLATSIDVDTPAQGARNAAILFLAPQKNQSSNGLLKDLDRISRNVGAIRGTALGALLEESGVHQEPEDGFQLVAPLLLNEGQESVIKAAMTRRLTVATGPPGTGKSQLVGNLVTTAVSNGQSVLVASTNNRAVNEVWERCERLVPGCLVRTGARSGTTNYRETERESLRLLATSPGPATNIGTARADLWQAREDFDRVVTRMADKARRETELLQIGEDREWAARELGRTPEELRTHFGDTIDLGGLAKRASRLSDARFLAGWRRRRFLRKVRWEAADGHKRACELIGAWADVERRWRTARAAMAKAPRDDELKHALDEHYEKFRVHSKRLLETSVLTTAKAGKRVIQSLVQNSAGQRDWAEVESALKHVRGWAVTNLSVRRFPTTAALFDLVVVDEASQCSIPQVLPVLFRAKRALIIGDPMQLEPVITLKPVQEASIRRGLGVSASWLEEHRCTFHRHSAFHAFDRAARGSALLDEHFRCHPAIAAVANDRFYGGELTVLTDTRKQRRMDRDPILWLDTSGTTRRRGGSWTNKAEIDLVNRSVQHLLEKLPPEGTVGVVSPFRAQAEAIEQQWRGNDRIQVGTVHTFQGSERDAIVFSLVAGPDTPKRSRVWLNGQLNLWNVAITRARAHLLVVGDREFWRRQGGVGAALVEAAERQADQQPDGDDSTEMAVDPLLLRLHKRLGLGTSTDSDVRLSTTVDGYLADALLRDNSALTAVLIDRGPGSNQVLPARHLRLQFERLGLLSGEDGARRCVRVPAWQLYCDQTSLLEHHKTPTA